MSTTKYPSQAPERAAKYAREWRARRQESAAGGPRPATCQVCGRPPGGRWGRVCFDHDHRTGLFRGWLCNRCNKALGLVGDNPARLRALADYLERSR